MMVTMMVMMTTMVVIMTTMVTMMIPDQVLGGLSDVLPHGGHHCRRLNQQNILWQRLANLTKVTMSISIKCQSIYAR